MTRVFEDITPNTGYLGYLATVIVVGLGLAFLARSVLPLQLERLTESTQVIHPSPVVSLSGDIEVEQSFLASSEKFTAISFYVLDVTETEKRNFIVFRLYEDDNQRPLVTKEFNSADMTPTSSFLVDFDEIKNARRHRYTFTLQSKQAISDTAVVLGGTYWDSYPDGQLMVNHRERNGDLSFIVYSKSTFSGSLWRGMEATTHHIVPLLLLFSLLFLSSIIIWSLIHNINADASLLLLATVVSSPLLLSLVLIGTDWLGLKFAPYILIPVCVILWLRSWRTTKLTPIFKRIFNKHALSLIFVSCFVLVIQMGFIRGITLPSYLDSVHHVILSKEIATVHELPAQLPPEQNSSPFIYHFGVHAFTAGITLLSNQTVAPEMALLVEGPVLLLLFSLGVYCLVRIVGYSHWCGLSGMILSTFALSMPSYVLNWGKYPLLFALATFCGTLGLFVMSLKEKASLTARIVVGLLIAANILGHTRMLFVWIVVFFLATIVTLIRLQNCRETARKLVLYSVGPLMIIGLWLLPRWLNRASVQSGAFPVGIAIDATNVVQPRQTLYPFEQVELVWITLLILGFLVMGHKKLISRFYIIFAILTLTIVSLVPVRFVPSERLLDAQFAHTTLTLPITVGLSIVIGYVQHLSRRLIPSPPWLIPTLMSIIAIFGLTARQSVPSLCCQLASKHDIETMGWIDKSVSPSSTVGIAAIQWENGQAVGVDGGYWIKALIGKKTTLPSLLYGFGDAHAQAATTKRAIDVDTTIRAQGDICRLNIDYVYMGGNSSSFEFPILETSPYLVLAYRNGSTAVFQVKGCEKQ